MFQVLDRPFDVRSGSTSQHDADGAVDFQDRDVSRPIIPCGSLFGAHADRCPGWVRAADPGLLPGIRQNDALIVLAEKVHPFDDQPLSQ
jgi:hypothetical protein